MGTSTLRALSVCFPLVSNAGGAHCTILTLPVNILICALTILVHTLIALCSCFNSPHSHLCHGHCSFLALPLPTSVAQAKFSSACCPYGISYCPYSHVTVKRDKVWSTLCCGCVYLILVQTKDINNTYCTCILKAVCCH